MARTALLIWLLNRSITSHRFFFVLIGTVVFSNLSLAQQPSNYLSEYPFGDDFAFLDSRATGRWWEKPISVNQTSLNVARSDVLAFAIYTVSRGVLKMTVQLHPLLPTEEKKVVLEFEQDGQWVFAKQAEVIYPGWSSHFRVESWDDSKDVRYRVRHSQGASLEGRVRANPVDQDQIVVGVLSCNSSRTTGPRETIVRNLIAQDPDLLFFAGDQSYYHKEHTYGWLEFGRQFRDVLLDRPVICIPDDHDVGQANLWGESGKLASDETGADGGYTYPAGYVNMVERCQTWHLPDPVDPTPIERGIGVYFTSYNLGGVDFAILEDRKFKSGPQGKVPQLGPRPDHINDPTYDRRSIDLPNLELLGKRQIQFLDHWGDDWTDAVMKCVLSQTAFCGAVHLHGNVNNRLLADLDCNGWPQAGRNQALQQIRKARAMHLCGDQHIATLVKHGIEQPSDGPYAFAVPAIVNTIYGRWWHPIDESAGDNAFVGSPLPWTGEYEDGLGNKIRMMAYANPGDLKDEKQRADGYGIVRFNKLARSVVVECWPRFCDVASEPDKQYPGWPVELKMNENDGRKIVGYLPRLKATNRSNFVVQVVDAATQEEIYTVRTVDSSFDPAVYGGGPFQVRVGGDRPSQLVLDGVSPHATAGEHDLDFEILAEPSSR